MQIPKNCEYCGKSFIAKTTVTKYCCQRCGSKAYKERARLNYYQLQAGRFDFRLKAA